MNREFCIFKSKKPCDNCGECERCDLNSNKKCNNCGKCLEKDGFDMKGIKIDEIIESEGETKEFNDESEQNLNVETSSESHYQLHNNLKIENDFHDDLDSGEEHYETCKDINEDYLDDYDYKEESLEELYTEDGLDDENIEYIDDIEGLSELLDDDDRLSEIAYEEFPGFIRLKRRNN